ncbi:hypothetical protein ACNKHQ_02290 [Shigella flexneri]
MAFQGFFACITVGLIVGALAERIRFSAVLIFVVIWLTLSYVPIAHMGPGGGSVASHVRSTSRAVQRCTLTPAVAGLVGAQPDRQTRGLGKKRSNRSNLPMVFIGTAHPLTLAWFGLHAGSASAANEIAGRPS